MKQIGIYAGKNLLRIILLLFAVSILTFALVTASPIDPLQANVGQAALGSMSEEQKEKLRSYWGVEEPPVQRYLNWLNAFIKGDAGTSLLYRQPVTKVIAVKLGNSLFLMGLAWIISGLVGFVLGVIAGVFQGRLPDKLIKGYSLVIASTPSFWLALLLLIIFGVWLKVLPIGLSVPIGVEASGVTFLDRVRHAILPAVTLSITGISNITLHTREKMIDIMESDYILFAKARGEKTGSIILHHGIRNVLLPAMTLQFVSVSEIIGGSVLVERVWVPGPSGYGKTTLCKILAGYLKPCKGQVLLDGKPLPQKGYCPVQMIWQHPEKAVNPRLKMEKILSDGGNVEKRIIEGLGIEKDWMNRYPQELSGGELQRFCIARALGKETQFLIADEISTMLDLITQSQIWSFLLEEVKRREIGLIVVSHSDGLLKQVARRKLPFMAEQTNV